MHRDSIWVELRFMGRSSFFEMQEGGRPIGIGSGWCTDLRIVDPKVALVHCELVRDADRVRLLPTGCADVRLNATHVGASATLPERSLIEFLDHEIHVVVHRNGRGFYAPGREELNALAEPAPITLGRIGTRTLISAR